MSVVNSDGAAKSKAEGEKTALSGKRKALVDVIAQSLNSANAHRDSIEYKSDRESALSAIKLLNQAIYVDTEGALGLNNGNVSPAGWICTHCWFNVGTGWLFCICRDVDTDADFSSDEDVDLDSIIGVDPDVTTEIDVRIFSVHVSTSGVTSEYFRALERGDEAVLVSGAFHKVHPRGQVELFFSAQGYLPLPRLIDKELNSAIGAIRTLDERKPIDVYFESRTINADCGVHLLMGGAASGKSSIARAVLTNVNLKRADVKRRGRPKKGGQIPTDIAHNNEGAMELLQVGEPTINSVNVQVGLWRAIIAVMRGRVPCLDSLRQLVYSGIGSAVSGGLSSVVYNSLTDLDVICKRHAGSAICIYNSMQVDVNVIEQQYEGLAGSVSSIFLMEKGSLKRGSLRRGFARDELGGLVYEELTALLSEIVLSSGLKMEMVFGRADFDDIMDRELSRSRIEYDLDSTYSSPSDAAHEQLKNALLSTKRFTI